MSSPAILTRCDSVEILSEEEIPADQLKMCKQSIERPKSDTEAVIIRREQIARRTMTKTATMSGLALKAEIDGAENEPEEMSKAQLDFDRTHMVTADGVLVFSSARTFMIERRISLEGAKIREIKHRSRGALMLTEKDNGTRYILKFRCRTDRQLWLRTIKRQIRCRPRLPETAIEFTPNKRRQIYFIDGPDEFRKQTETIQVEWNRALMSETNLPRNVPDNKFKKTIRKLSRTFTNCFKCHEV